MGGTTFDLDTPCCVVLGDFFLTLLGMGATFLGSDSLLLWNLCRHDKSVSQKDFTTFPYCNTVMCMANVLSTDKQIAVIGALAEGSSIRSIERMTGVHRDTIMRLGVRVGHGCAGLLDAKMRVHPIKSAQDAVRAAILQEARNLEPES
jgi:uncharacterized protein YerC